jgi:PAS domain S-box-containing protein
LNERRSQYPRPCVVFNSSVNDMPEDRAIQKDSPAANDLSVEIASLRLQSAALKAAANAVVITDRDGAIVWVNPAFTTLTGYTFAEAIGKNPRDLVKSGKQELAVYQNLWETILTGGIWQGELVNRRKNGATYSEEQTITPVCNAAGEPTHFIAIKRDLTERNQAGKALRLFRELLDQSNDSIEVVDPVSARFLDVNESAPTSRGYSREEFLSMRVFDIDPTVSESDWPQLAERIRTAGSIRGEGFHRRKDGTLFPIEFNAKWVRLDRDYILTVARDISERRRAESALRASEERYRQLFDSNPVSMWLYDMETLRFLAVNESAVQHYGYTREEFLAMTIKAIQPEGDIPALLESVEKNLAESKSSGDGRHRRKDGTIIRVEIVSRALMFDGRKAQLVLATDITEKKMLEEKFLHAQRLENIGMLAAGIAHDLNNVLAPILMAAQMLRGSLSSPSELKLLNTVEHSAGRGASLVRQILGFARGATGDFQATQVKHLANDVISVIEQTFPKSIRLEHKIPNDLWVVQGNPTQIHQVLLNLCVNARDAMPQGGTLRIAVANRELDETQARLVPGARPGGWLVIEVADTGTGIAPDILANVWDPFFTTKSLGKGTGLGLSTVRGIVASHNGFVTLDTQLGQGTTFRVFLPAAAEKLAAKDLAPVFAVPTGNNELVLVVDDEAAVRETVAAILSKHGYRVLGAEDGVEAVNQVITHSAELVLVVTDVDMPRLGGAALARILAQLRPEMRLLVISGLSPDKANGSELEEAKNLTHGFLLKPFSPEALLEIVYSVLHPPAKP